MPDEIVTVTSRAGSALFIIKDPREYIQNIWRKKGKFFEDRVLEYIYWHYKGRDFIDVGSCMGNHTIFFSLFCEPKCVISVEPTPSSCAHQREMLKLNKIDRRVILHECAVSDKPGRGSLKPWDLRHPFASNQLVPGDDVEVTTIDLLLSDRKNINLMKIDVEKGELGVLHGAESTLDRCRPALFLEFRTRGIKASCVEFLSKFGYKQIGSHFQDSTLAEFTV